MLFKIDQGLFEKNEDICAGVVIAENFDGSTDANGVMNLLSAQIKTEKDNLKEKSVKDLAFLKPYHENMEKLGINPSKYPCSIESLLTRLARKGELPGINSAVDLGNYISLKFKLPVGVHDQDTFTGDLCIRLADSEDVKNNTGVSFEDFSPGEPIYAVQNSVRTRRWIWRQMPAGRITPEAKNIVFPIDGFSSNRETIEKACLELSEILEKNFNCTVRTGILDKEHPSIKLSQLDEDEKEIENTIKIMLKGVMEHSAVADIREKLSRLKRENSCLRVKLGLDPTAPDIHLGHTVVLRKIRQLQDLGHKAIIIIGDFTGKIGDPSGKSKTRNQLNEEEVQRNARTYQDQIFKILDKNKTEVCFNSQWFDVMTFTEVIKLTATSTVARILEREDFKNRYDNKQPIGMHELIYPFLQGYDSVAIRADVELGGTDQTFNILFGRDMQRAHNQEPQITLFMPLLEGTDGKEKMSKSLGNYIGINEDPSVIFEKIMKIPDPLIIKYYNLCTDLHPDETEKIQQRLNNGENPRDIKIELALEITTLYCGKTNAENAHNHFIQAYQQNKAPDDIAVLSVGSEGQNRGENLINAIAELNIYKYKGEIRTLFKQGAISLNNEKIKDPRDVKDLKNDDILQIGKGKFYKIHIAGV
jgi:tyrosyl-tRNA synthetase